MKITFDVPDGDYCLDFRIRKVSNNKKEDKDIILTLDGKELERVTKKTRLKMLLIE
jgi:hypothetical protein